MKSNIKDGRSQGELSGYAQRLLSVMEVIALDGPITLSHLVEKTQIPKASAWRIVTALEHRGWVRARMADHAWELTIYLDRLLLKANISPLDSSDIEEIFSRFSRFNCLQISIGIFTSDSEYVWVDGVRSKHLFRSRQSLAFDIAPTAALLACTRTEALRHLTRFSRNASKEERDYILSGEKIREISELAPNVIVWRLDKTGFAVPMKLASGFTGSIEIGQSSDRRHDRNQLLEAAMFTQSWAKA